MNDAYTAQVLTYSKPENYKLGLNGQNGWSNVLKRLLYLALQQIKGYE